ncbi:hypothetical protein EZJ43_00220 [Pedobacter changchengzhani]|uniref:Uncharacterized protein n=1 Tax=Pedobacter changchengzhani TaxID=2529274 RepID=A0A4R5MPJ7_9SPHI|nr:DUF6804 family protein [Pedobacter changchengzhani]TDG37556.1 hypothetical protein EZJ43_00220 [Pedobacter changchengzhani]
MPKLVKTILAILLFLCLLNMPYGYYELVRFVAMIAFAYLAYEANRGKKQTEVIVYIGLALLFQPFFKIALGRGLWNVLDVIVGVGLVTSLFIKPKQQDDLKNNSDHL